MTAPIPGADWTARLHLGFERQGPRTVLAKRVFEGPLRVQKALYPEGPGVCHVHVLHPPSGIAEGDDLSIHVDVAQQAHAVLTTPGATQWYKSAQRGARMALTLQVQAGGVLEWLPLENLFFDDCWARMRTRIDLAPDCYALGWDGGQWGRRPQTDVDHRVCGLSWHGARVSCDTMLAVGGEPLWLEQGQLASGDALMNGAQGWGGYACQANLWCYHPLWTAQHAHDLADGLPWGPDLRAAISCLPREAGPGGLLLLRVLGVQMQPIRALLARVRSQLHGWALQRPAADLRIWAT